MNRPPHLAGLSVLIKARVDHVLVGALAVGHYAAHVSGALVTADCDVLIKPSAANLARALRALDKAGWVLQGGGEPLGTVDDALLKGLVFHRALVKASADWGLPVDLMLEAQPYPYARWRSSSRIFTADGLRLRVGALAMLLEAKRRANRPKDRAFLAQWKALNAPKK